MGGKATSLAGLPFSPGVVRHLRPSWVATMSGIAVPDVEIPRPGRLGLPRLDNEVALGHVPGPVAKQATEPRNPAREIVAHLDERNLDRRRHLPSRTVGAG
jgi:hypothetical protein